MRLFRVTFSIWHDRTWRFHFKKSWKVRRYWFAVIEKAENKDFKGARIQLGMFSIHVRYEGRLQ